MGAGEDRSSPGRSPGRLTPADVHHVLFTRAGLGRRGYDEVEVDVFLQRVERELAELIVERDDLRDDVARLEAQLRKQGVSPKSDAVVTQEDVQREGVRLADAARSSERTTRAAHEQAEQMVAEARRAAARVLETGSSTREVDVAASDAGLAPVGSEQRLEQHVLQLTALGHLVRVQLSTYLEALLRDVQEEWERAVPGAAPRPPDAEPTAPDAVPRPPDAEATAPHVEPTPAESAAPPDAEATAPDVEPPPTEAEATAPNAEAMPAEAAPAAEVVPDTPGTEGAAPGGQDSDRDAAGGEADAPAPGRKARPRKRTVKMHIR